MSQQLFSRVFKTHPLKLEHERFFLDSKIELYKVKHVFGNSFNGYVRLQRGTRIGHTYQIRDIMQNKLG